MSKRVADLLVETLQAAGVKTCYGIVGDTLNRIAHAIDQSEIDWVHMRHEETGAFAAGAEALLTGRLTACAGSCGPGSLHFINGLYAWPYNAGAGGARTRDQRITRRRRVPVYTVLRVVAQQLSHPRHPVGSGLFPVFRGHYR
jgi:Thiamine pyrophosphate enzyme, N-terminal TPP binding domain